jgi:RimJ/RimL family protein N-acetyltransferase
VIQASVPAVPPIPLPEPALADGEIRLREPGPGDIPALTAACQDPLIQRFTFVPVPYAESDARAFVAGRPAARAAGEAIALVMSPADGDELLGMIGLQRFDWDHRTCDIGYWVVPEARGRGAATRAVVLLSHWGIRELGMARIQLDADIDNLASQRVSERAGFTREGVLRSVIEVKGRRWTEVIHSLIAEDLA